ncbi:type IV pili twitching motility protein PilT [Candidatus Daviesbacteria bacterium RIFCSPHIGHO2_01_FULL_43_17]|nr:MAG: type IV pili twitching motility protein PilT [Candidatus Daviesbacteria bacterium RIFCSPHIGHO2_01_FULL_43_17]
MNIQQLLELAVVRNASDIHLVAGYPPTLRVHGELVPVVGTESLTDSEISGLILSILTPVQKSVLENNFELDFAIPFQNKARFRVNVFKEQGHLGVSLRLIPLLIPAMESLGLPPVVSKLTSLRQGLVLVTGPTGHGKSTTLAAMINQINMERSVHILTIEDPIEYVYPKAKGLVSQREMYLDTKSWPNALRAALREDPDVVLVGEMRDYETIAAAITVAETGHLVFATLHTNSASQSVDRIIDVFPVNQQSQIRLQLAVVLEAILSQRLVPTVNPGRVLAVELLLRTPALSELIRSSKAHLIDNLIQTSGELGMVNLETSLAKLVGAGKITMETAQGYSLRPDLLARLLGG